MHITLRAVVDISTWCTIRAVYLSYYIIIYYYYSRVFIYFMIR